MATPADKLEALAQKLRGHFPKGGEEAAQVQAHQVNFGRFLIG
jgi:hypothetical protein